MNTLPLNPKQQPIGHHVNVSTLLHRLDEQAYEQLCAEVVRLAEVTERLERELIEMESCADGWREDAMALHDQLAAATGGTRGITLSGELVVVAQHDADMQDIDAPLSPEDAAWLDAWLANADTDHQICLQEGPARG